MWPDVDKTRQLVEQAQTGDSSAVNRLLDHHRQVIRHLVRIRLDRRVQQRVDVSDVVQDVLVEANRRLSDYLSSVPMPFHLWLRQITHDRIIDTHRRHRASAKRSVDREQRLVSAGPVDQSSIDLAAQIADPEMTPAEAATRHELGRQVELAIGDLSDADAEMLIMRHYEHLSNQEVAQLLGLTEPAASMRYLRAVRRLRELLTNEESSIRDSQQRPKS